MKIHMIRLISLLLIMYFIAINTCADTILFKYDEYIYTKDYSISGIYYENGKEVAQIRHYYNNPANVTIEGIIPDGKVTIYYPDGKYRGFMNYKNGRLDGEYKSYFENGRLAFESFYLNGKLDGISKSYNSDGKLCRTNRYRDGERIIGIGEKTGKLINKGFKIVAIPFEFVGLFILGLFGVGM